MPRSSSEVENMSVEGLERVCYDEIENKLQPLDLLMFRGGDFVSASIRYLEEKMLGNGSFSHVGIVVTRELMPWLKVLEYGEKYVWESTMSIPIGGFVEDVPDVESGKGRFGVQIRVLEDVVESYTNTESGALVAWVPLKDNPWADEFQVLYYYLWHHEGRRARHGAMMAGPDWAHWEGFFILMQDLYSMQDIYAQRIETGEIEQ